MLTGELRSKIDNVWNAFWAGGIANPLEVIEQITYLLFMRGLDDAHTLAERKANRLRKPIERRIFPPGKDKVGRIDAISVETGRTVWSWETRVANYSPLLATGSGLLFNGGLDHYLRALDADTGQVIWQTRLPSQTVGGAITYSINGRQYIAIAAGGGAVAGTQFSMTPEADMASGNNAIYVFALPQ